MQTTADIVKIVETDNRVIFSELLKGLIKDNRERAGVEKRMLARYDQREIAVPIMTRKVEAYEKVNVKIPNDFAGDIVDLKTGYMGNEITITIDKEAYGPETEAGNLARQGEYDLHREVLENFGKVNHGIDQNSDMVQTATICGHGFRLLYIAEMFDKKIIKYRNLYPFECAVFRDRTTGEVQYGMIYYTIVVSSINGRKINEEERMYVEWYDDKKVSCYIEDNEGNYILDPAMDSPIFPHWFDGVPIIEFQNNNNNRGNIEKITDLIDAYDIVLSDTVSEIEQLRSAYMFMKGAGMKIDESFTRMMRQTGILPLPDNGEVGFINRNIDAESIKTILDELRRNIYQFAKSIDLTAQKSGDMRVIGWKIALLNLENDCKETERKFKSAMYDQYRLVCKYWRTFNGIDMSPDDLEFMFTRNFPQDILGEVEILEKAIGLMTRKTAYGLVSFIEDPEAEARAYEEENPAPTVNMDQYGFGNGEEEE